MPVGKEIPCGGPMGPAHPHFAGTRRIVGARELGVAEERPPGLEQALVCDFGVGASLPPRVVPDAEIPAAMRRGE